MSLTACSGGSQTPAGIAQNPASPAASEFLAKAKKPMGLLFASDFGAKAIYAYDLKGTGQAPLWTLSGLPLQQPSGLWVDGSANLYVADQTGHVFEYDAPTASGPPAAPSFVYDDTATPDAVAECGKYVYAANALGNGSHESMTVWQKGIAKPLRVATSPNYNSGVGEGVTCDTVGSGHAYFGYVVQDNGPGEIDEWAADGSGKPTSLKMLPPYLQGLTKSISGLLVIGDEFANPNPAIQFYKETGSEPIRQLSGSWVGEPVGMAYESKDQALWIADGYFKTLTRVAPGTGKVLNVVVKPGFKELSGVAVSPADHT